MMWKFEDLIFARVAVNAILEPTMSEDTSPPLHRAQFALEQVLKNPRKGREVGGESFLKDRELP